MFLLINVKLLGRAYQGPMAVVINEYTKSISIKSGRILQVMNVYDKYTDLEFESEEECLKAYLCIMKEIDGYMTTTICKIVEEEIHHDRLKSTL